MAEIADAGGSTRINIDPGSDDEIKYPPWPPAPPKDPPTTSGGGGTHEIEWVFGDYAGGANAPPYWQPMTVKNKADFKNPEVAWTLMANALLGSGALGAEGSRNLAKQLYSRWGGRTGSNPWDVYSDKFDATDTFTPPSQLFADGVAPREITRINDQAVVPQSRNQAAVGHTGPTIDEGYFRSGSRGTDVLNSLSNMRAATVGGNVHEFGAGYQYLQNIAGALEGHDGGGTRAQRQSLMGELDPLLAQGSGGELGGYGELGRMIAQPYMTNMSPGFSKNQSGNYNFGKMNPYLNF